MLRMIAASLNTLAAKLNAYVVNHKPNTVKFTICVCVVFDANTIKVQMQTKDKISKKSHKTRKNIHT
ncbi:hypothetical protein HMPREF3204_00229 [Gardnerella pickettii]|nr:hypothetical protein HMPREF3204_00229 [Gardnerella pickettii]CRH74973.1 Uncharacterised protein [Chlamydia trachomatis]